jgi:hypothetical protein
MTLGNNHEIKLVALDGSNLLAFMAALGTLRTLSQLDFGVGPALCWKQSMGIWHPTLYSSLQTSEVIADSLYAQLTPSAGNGKDDVGGKRKEAEKLFKAAEKGFKKIKKEKDKELKTSLATARNRFFKDESDLAGTKKEHQARLKAKLDEIRQCHQAALAKKQAEVTKLERKWMEYVRAGAPFPYLGLGDDFAVAPDIYREFLLDSLSEASRTRRVWADFAACFASDAASRDGVVMDTAFRAVGGGQTRILNEMKKIVENTSKAQIETSLFKSWDYPDSSPVMRWDPNEHRPYALRANDPANDQSRVSMRGANRLAIEALPLFPVMPSNRRISTTGFSRLEDGMVTTWPIWSEPLRLDAIRTLLALGELQQQIVSPQRLQERGIVQVFRSLRFGKEYRNFSPASALL